ncbi:MAG: tRNA (guanine(46)-N(7))-methyltransferase TrmB [Rhodospirillaceae bacterium]|nr:tRNA (guanine(46)-N(7))-methyltransferase TrmB [Rhodospirillaceae bacterium]
MAQEKNSANATNQSSRVLYYGRRKGKPLKPQRAALVDELLPQLRIAPPPPGARIDPHALFPRNIKDIWLEVGFGGGEHLAAQAAANPNVGIIGCEVFLNGVASLVRHVADRNLTNVRIFDEDARLLLPALPDCCLSRVFLLFPDPWPKARHAKRRFIGPQNLATLARLMKPGAELRVASDHPVYIAWALEQVPPHPAFAWSPQGPEDWRGPPGDHVRTRYEQKAEKEGRKPAFFRFFRTDSGPQKGAMSA